MTQVHRSFPRAVSACLLVVVLATAGTASAQDFRPKSSLVTKGDSAAAQGAAESYVPSGAIVADSGFRPTVDGFAFENYGNEANPRNLGVAQMQDLFGDQVCLPRRRGRACRLTPSAAAWMKNQNDGMDGGHCQGFSVSALRFHAGLLDEREFGAATTAGLEIVGNRPLQAAIAENFTYQFLPPIVKKRVTGRPSRILRTLAAALKSGKELYTLGVYKRDFSGGHAITPFAIEDKGGGRYAILVYDNNFPGATRAVNVDLTSETWDYVSGTNPRDLGQLYRGTAKTETLELDPTLPVEKYYSPCPFCKPSRARKGGRKQSVLAKADRYTEITLGGDPRNHPHLVFTDDKGRRTGVVGDEFLREIPDVEVIKTFATRNWEGAPEPRFRIPEGKDYTITVDGSALERPTTTDVDLVGNGLVIEVEDIKMKPGQKDEMALPGGYGITYQSNGDEEEAPNFFAGLEEDEFAYNFAATAVGIKKGSTVSLLVEQKEKVVILDSTGSKGTLGGGKGIFILNLARADGNGRIDQWTAADVRLNGAKEEKAAFEYAESPRPGRSLPIVVLDKNADTRRIVKAKPGR